MYPTKIPNARKGKHGKEKEGETETAGKSDPPKGNNGKGDPP